MGIMINAEKEVIHICDWIKDYFAKNGANSKAIVGISGGKDSTIVTGLLCKALGSDRVIGVRMPQGIQHDLDVAKSVCDLFNIENYEINIENTVKEMYNQLYFAGLPVTKQIETNTPARVRMANLYMMAASLKGRVANTCNFSEDYVGYSTKFGDNAGDFSILGKYTVREVKAIGYALKTIPIEYIEKIPEDGMCGKSDEDNLGFSYTILDDYLLNNIIPEPDILQRIQFLHNNSLHKHLNIPTCPVSARFDEEGREVYNKILHSF